MRNKKRKGLIPIISRPAEIVDYIDKFCGSSLFDTSYMRFPKIRLYDLPERKVREDEKNVFVEVDIPGFEKNEIDIIVENRLIVINAKKDDESIRRSVSLSYTLPANVDINKSKAEYNNGVLRVTLPKSAKQEVENKIKIE